MKIKTMDSSATDRRPIRDRAFTFIEFLVAIAIIGLILASIVPFVMAKREMSRRVQCANNLRQIQYAMSQYRQDYITYPRTRFDQNTTAWNAYTGADDATPFAALTTTLPATTQVTTAPAAVVRSEGVQANDVTASLWLLVRIGYLPDTAVFVCPSSDRIRDPMTNAAGQRVKPTDRGNFRSGRHLAYSVLSPFNISPFVWDDTLPAECALLADMNPGTSGKGDDVTKAVANDPIEQQTWSNSSNHGKAGQNVLRADGSVRFESHAFVGMGYVRPGAKDQKTQSDVPSKPGDNIYTSLRAAPNTPDGQSPLEGQGAFGKTVGPNWKYDSYLLPSDDD